MDFVTYYNKEFWNINGDPLTSSFPGMESPWTFIMITLSIVLFCKVWGPALMSNRKPPDLRPVFIIVNGLMFGAYTIGIFLAFFLTNKLKETFQCSAYDPNTSDLCRIYLKYLGYLLLIFKCLDFNVPILSVLSKRMDKVTNLQLAYLTFTAWLCWAGMKLNPGGVFILSALVDTLVQSFIYGYLVMMSASKELKPKSRDSFLNFIIWLRMVSLSIALIHQGYFLIQDNCYTRELRFLTAIYIASVIIFYPIDFANRRKARVGREKELRLMQEVDNNANLRNN